MFRKALNNYYDFRGQFKCFAACGLVLTTSSAMCAEMRSRAIEEIVVTAQKSLQTLETVPVAVTVFDEKTLVTAGIVNIANLAQMTPGLAISSFNKSTPAPYIRGIGTNDSHVADDPSVSVFIDDVYISRPGSFDSTLFDLERVEVLRGPQGTLWGKNVAGGAIVMTTRQPQQTFEGAISATTGNYSLEQWSLYSNGPLTDVFSGKLAINQIRRDGYIDNVRVGGTVSDDDELSTRAALRWSPSSALDVQWNMDVAHDHAHGTGRVALAGTPPPSAVIPRPPQLGDFNKTAAYTTGYTNRKDFGSSVNINYEAEETAYTSITAWRHNQYDFLDPILPFAIEPYVALGFPADFELFLRNQVAEESRQFSQELRMNRFDPALNLDWTVGLYYFNSTVDRNEWLAGQADASNETQSKAVFGQLTKTLGPDELWNLTLGIRYTAEEKAFEQRTLDVTATKSWNNTATKFSIDYMGFEHGMLYLSYAEGFKSGTFNAFASTPQQATTALAPELAAQWELGAKLHGLQHSLQANIAVFHTNYDNIQVFDFDSSLAFNIINATATTQGVEIELVYQPFAGLELTGSYAYLHAQYDQYTSNAGDYRGNRLQRAPEHSYSAAAEYSVTDHRGMTWLLRADLTHQDEVFFAASNNPNMRGNAHTLLNLRASLNLPDTHWQLSVWGRNLTDEKYTVFENDTAVVGLPGLRSSVPGMPRTYGMTVDYRW